MRGRNPGVMSLQEIKADTPLERFVLALKEEFDILFEENQLMKKEIEMLKREMPVAPHIESMLIGSDWTSLLFLRYPAKNIKEFADKLYRLCHVNFHYFVAAHSTINDVDLIEAYVGCREYVSLAKLSRKLVQMQMEEPDPMPCLVYLVNLQRTPDAVTCRYHVISKQMHLTRQTEYTVYVAKNNKIVERSETKVPVPSEHDLSNHRENTIIDYI